MRARTHPFYNAANAEVSVKQAQPTYGLVRYAQQLHVAAGKLKYTQETLDRATLDQLEASTPPEILNAAADVHITRRYYETGTNDGFQRTYRKFPSTYNQVRVYTRSSQRLVKREYTNKKTKKTHLRAVPSGSGQQHLSIIRFYGPPGGSTPVWVWCDCAAFTYQLEKALTDQGSSSIKNSNGEDPDVRNPMKVGYLCKHLVVTARWAASLGKDLANEKYQKEEAAKEQVQQQKQRQEAQRAEVAKKRAQGRQVKRL
jgi:hypothetical protein